MKRYQVLIGSEVNFVRSESADTLAGILRKQTAAENNGKSTQLIDTSITTTDDLDRLQYAEIDRDGKQTGWRDASALDC